MHEDEQKLADVHPDQTFRTQTGKEIKNLKQLLHVLEDISPDSFAHHVNGEKNDFGSWIRHSVKDDELADMIEKTTDFDKTKQIIGDRIALLEKKIEVRKIKESLEDLKADTMGIDQASDEIEEPPEDEIPEEKAPESMDEQEQTDDMGGLSVPSPNDEMETPKEELAPAEPPSNFVTKDEHPFEHLKKGLHLTIRDVLIGVVIGMIIGWLLGAYLA